MSLIWISCGIAFMLWQLYSFQARGVGQFFLESDTKVRVEETSTLYRFTPTQSYRNVLIFFPGALVDPKAYVPLCRRIAGQDIMVCLVKMPWRLASKGYNRPKELNLFEDTTKRYILAGHSQGAKMAAQFVFENPGLADKLILLATTHPRDIDLSGLRIPVMKIYGSHDGVADQDKVDANRSRLPASAEYVLIQGANHAQFGYYGPQLGDNRPGISLGVQQNSILENMLSFINQP